MHIGIRIKEKREQLGLTQEELAFKLGYKSKSTINKIEMGVNDITQSKVVLFAEILKTTTAYLMGWEDSEEDITSVKIPVLGRVAAGIPLNAVEYIIDYEEIPIKMARTGEFFGLQIKGDSMEPRIWDGDVVIVKKQSTVNNGEIAIVLVNGDAATCKKISIQNDGIFLISLNPSFEPRFYSKKEVQSLPVEIIGKVVELRGKL